MIAIGVLSLTGPSLVVIGTAMIVFLFRTMATLPLLSRPLLVFTPPLLVFFTNNTTLLLLTTKVSATILFFTTLLLIFYRRRSRRSRYRTLACTVTVTAMARLALIVRPAISAIATTLPVALVVAGLRIALALCRGGLRLRHTHVQHWIRMVLYYRDGLLDQLVDVAEVFLFLFVAERVRHAVGACPARATDAMYIRFGYVRQFVVDHVRQVVDVNAACGDVGCYQYAGVLRFEVAQRALTGALRFVSVDGLGTHTGVIQVTGHAVGAMLGAREDEGR